MGKDPPNNGGDKRSEIGDGMWVLRCPHHLCYKKKTPVIGGISCQQKSGRHDIHLLLGGIILFEQGGMWISRHLILAITGNDPPQNDGGGDKKA